MSWSTENARVPPAVVICTADPASKLTRRLTSLLQPHVSRVHVSKHPEDVVTPSLTIVLHGWGSLEPFAALREFRLKFNSPVIVVVPQRAGSMILELLRAGATDCVRWPASSADAELLARVRIRLTPARQNITLDTTSLTLTCCDVIARLTVRELRIVHHLLQNAARWSTTEEMTTVALGSGHSSASVVRVRIYAIRRKLKNQAWRLRSNRALGYRFDTCSSSRDPTSNESNSLE